MNGVANNVGLLKNTNQHLVFENDRARTDTATLIRSLFSLTTAGLVRIEYLTEQKCDRELVGHLLAMLVQSNHNLQEEVKRLKSEMFCMFLKNKELEEESNGLAEENTNRFRCSNIFCNANSYGVLRKAIITYMVVRQPNRFLGSSALAVSHARAFCALGA